ncbi:hypothetical protein GCM10027168_14720 [Streptomyces capparidis]
MTVNCAPAKAARAAPARAGRAARGPAGRPPGCGDIVILFCAAVTAVGLCVVDHSLGGPEKRGGLAVRAGGPPRAGARLSSA